MSKRNALRLVSTRGMARAKWLEVRKGGIGSSDAAAAVGLSPYKSQLELWMEKTGRVSNNENPPDQSSSMFWGTLLEPYVATVYTQRTGRKVRRLNAVLQHPSFPYMLANIDREVIGCPDVQILECKTAGEFGTRLWKEGVPEYVQLQVQHQLVVTGKDAADVAVLLCGQELEVHRIQRDDEVIGRLLVLEAKFWEYVEKDIPPPTDGSESAGNALRQLYRGDDTVVDFSQDEVLSGKFAELAAIKETIDTQVARAEVLKQALQEAMAEASKAIFKTGEVTFKRAKDSEVIDVKLLVREHPNLVAKYTSIRPGSRRFRIATEPHP
ncbi:MAG: YqaJ viral recombinase family protein [Xanthomonadales bacterium]|nr:YqaJ viral recombinase family protein [Xanthomonadales bacterium]ODU55948.1 MAG: endonuclease [Comamonadaceae bacterium SCN 68-20]OJY87092.1 MAG: endonuclease [Xanthomonadales bacterium 66-474]